MAKPFLVELSKEHRSALDGYRAWMGLRSEAEAIRHLIDHHARQTTASQTPSDPLPAGTISAISLLPLTKPAAGAQPVERLPIGTIRKRMTKEAKSGVPLMVKDELVGYSGNTPVWQTLK